MTESSRVHVWWLTVPPDEDVSSLRGVLTPEEAARVAPWGSSERIRSFVLGRALLQHAGWEWPQPKGWLAFEDNGRPFCVPPGTDVSLSHAGDHVLVAMASGGRVGVDVEVHQVRQQDLLNRFFHPEEHAWMAQDLGRLHRLWTLKEAALKAMGLGVSGDPLRVRVSGAQDHLTVAGAEPRQPWCASLMRDSFSASVVLLRDPGQPVPSLAVEPVSLRALQLNVQTQTLRKTA
jgi:phosphopantetheinyl transferase